MNSAARTTSSTARPAEKGAEAGVDPALLRRMVGAVVTMTGCRRSEARQRVNAWLGGGKPLAGQTGAGDDADQLLLEAYLRATYRADPVGVTAVRNADRERGAA